MLLYLSPAVCLAMLAAGCGSSDLVPVSGTVRLEGKPLSSGSVQFSPSGGGRPAFGDVAADGGFQLSTAKLGDGARPGSYWVSVI
ncbi:MAG TPA: carboxypeptidase regulatory-like domain-containing protein, partial [Lacipirellulaceae bacterium]|nr:carboxypeptidase regulatory-like domain-containing protein [Lacipirellulaceae bacterium]